jgi:predicted DNA-binding transcriptional regulator AlpA
MAMFIQRLSTRSTAMQSIPSVPVSGFMPDHELCHLLGDISHATLWRWTKARLVPAAVKIGPNRNGRRREEVREYQADPEAWRAAHGESLANYAAERAAERGARAVA